MVTGDLLENIDVLINGRPGTPMAAFGRQLNPVELAAVVTYIRNSFGNTTGDLVQPAEVNSIIQAAQ